MTDFSENAMQAVRKNYYPQCPQPEKVIGLTPHSDGSTLTILLQVYEVEGLQIKKDGKWTPVSPLRNAFIVNIGDMFEVLTIVYYLNLGIYIYDLSCITISEYSFQVIRNRRSSITKLPFKGLF